MVKVVIDGSQVEVIEGSTILEAAEKAGAKVPTLCYLKGIYSGAVCRICSVEVKGLPRLVPACAYPVAENMVVSTDSRRVREARRMILEMILATHKQDCQSCSLKGGDCKLLELAAEYWLQGFSVCNECRFVGKDCLLEKGELCLGPITLGGCRAICTASGYTCEGCRGPLLDIEFGLSTLRKYGIDWREILRRLGKYSLTSERFRKAKERIEAEANLPRERVTIER
ncbi:MAG: 2Fe-2S iron-sulfur cluster-binding protein [Candidatus Bathyarchaeia archaeon]